MNLSAEERRLVRSTWALVSANRNEAGVELFIRSVCLYFCFLLWNSFFFFSLFTAHPKYLAFFSFRDVEDLEVLRTDRRLKAHVRNVMYSFSMLVDNLEEEEEVLEEMIAKIAANHRRRKLNAGDFARLKTALLGLLTDSLGTDVMTAEATTAWSKTYDLLVDAMKDNGGDDDGEKQWWS